MRIRRSNPVVVYSKYSCVIIFKNAIVGAEYLFNNPLRSNMIYTSIKTLYINSSNVFKMPLTFHYATEEQKKQLNGEEYIILDNKFKK